MRHPVNSGIDLLSGFVSLSPLSRRHNFHFTSSHIYQFIILIFTIFTSLLPFHAWLRNHVFHARLKNYYLTRTNRAVLTGSQTVSLPSYAQLFHFLIYASVSCRIVNWLPALVNFWVHIFETYHIAEKLTCHWQTSTLAVAPRSSCGNPGFRLLTGDRCRWKR